MMNVSSKHRCKECNLEYSTKRAYNAHVIFSHKTTPPSVKKILILGGGFAGMAVLQEIEKQFSKDIVSITLVNEENYFLYTPMLPQVAAGMIHPSDIAVPIRTICNKARFYQAVVSDVDLDQKLVTVISTFDGRVRTLEYDYLVVALGGKNNFFGNTNIERYSFTIKTLEDAISIRNHTITMLENAAQTQDVNLQKKFLTFTVIGGGFAGVETIGELNDFVRQAVRHAYPSIDEDNISMNLISARSGILPEVTGKLGKDAMRHLGRSGVNVIANTRAIDATEDKIVLDDGSKIPCTTIVWAGGITTDSVISSLNCNHGKCYKIPVDKFLRIPSKPEVFALGDCAEISDSIGNPYPPTAQHALHQGKIVAQNLVSCITGNDKLKEFSYQSKGMMATIGNRVGLVSIMSHNLSGTAAWFIWRSYYLSKLPTLEKKIKVAADWTIDLLFKRDLTLVGKIKKKQLHKAHIGEEIPSLKEQLIWDL